MKNGQSVGGFLGHSPLAYLRTLPGLLLLAFILALCIVPPAEQIPIAGKLLIAAICFSYGVLFIAGLASDKAFAFMYRKNAASAKTRILFRIQCYAYGIMLIAVGFLLFLKAE